MKNKTRLCYFSLRLVATGLKEKDLKSSLESPQPGRCPRSALFSLIDDIDDDERDVIPLCTGRGLPEAKFSEQLTCQFGWRAGLILSNDLFEPAVAKGIAAGVFRFNQTIRVKAVRAINLDRKFTKLSSSLQMWGLHCGLAIPARAGLGTSTI